MDLEDSLERRLLVGLAARRMDGMEARARVRALLVWHRMATSTTWRVVDRGVVVGVVLAQQGRAGAPRRSLAGRRVLDWELGAVAGRAELAVGELEALLTQWAMRLRRRRGERAVVVGGGMPPAALGSRATLR